jgi:hypothetical protein
VFGYGKARAANAGADRGQALKVKVGPFSLLWVCMLG